MVQVSRKDLERLAIGFGIADFLTEGALTKPIARSTKSALRKAAPAIGRGIIRYGPKVALTAARVTPTPLAAAVTGAAIVANREVIRDAAGNVYERVAPAVQDYGAGVVQRAMDPQSFMLPEGPTQAEQLGFRLPSSKRRRKIASKFNQAVKRGMSIVKGSTSYGKKGTINNAKKAFTAVTKAASAVNKGRKAPAKGIARKLHTAMTKIIGKKNKTKKTGKTKYKITVNR